MAGKFTVKSLDHLVLTVRNIPKTVAWYTNYLGMRHEVFTSPANQTVQRYPSFANSGSLFRSKG
jgi:catechol 2,3-dioxygenase-like lactoylglutathione lyase family enzyme